MYCAWEPPTFLIFSSNVPHLLFYSHIPGMIISLIVGILLFTRNKKNLQTQLLLIMTALFFGWAFFDLILWATNDPRTVIFFWTNQIIFEPLIFITGVYLMMSYIKKGDISLRSKVFGIILYLPIIIFAPTVFTLLGVDIFDCNALEGPIAQYYTYFLELFIAIVGFVWAFYNISKTIDVAHREASRYLLIGLALFFIAFSWGNIIGSFTDNWQLAQVGLLGMPVFVGYIGYIMVRFQAFNSKLVLSQALTIASIVLVGSQFFFTTTSSGKILTTATLVLISIIGFILVRSARREKAQLEKIQNLAGELSVANTKLQSLDKLKTEFLSLASHQLRSPLTAIKGYTSMLLEGSFGTMTIQQKEAVDRVFQSVSHLTKVVNDLLNVSKIEQGGMKYEMVDYNFGKSVKSVVDELTLAAKNKNLSLSYEEDTKAAPFMINGDEEKVRQVIINLIDNSIKYTQAGNIWVRVSKTTGRVLMSIHDTGMGMTEEIRQTLFKKFARGEGGKVNTSGSGLGLYLAKEIVEAHHGRVWVESPGPGKGSTFFVEFESVKNL